MTVGRPMSRRRLLAGGAAAAVGGAALAGTATAGLLGGNDRRPGSAGAGGAGAAGAGTGGTTVDGIAVADPAGAGAAGAGPVGARTEPFHGPHQAGIATPAQAHASFIAFDLRPGTDRPALVRMMSLLSDDAARLAQARPPLADTEPELAGNPARLTVTFGFGPGLFAAAGLADRCPVRQLPAFPVDRLRPEWTGGDLLFQVCSDDQLALSHAQRMLVKDTRAFATVRWVQRGFRHSPGVRDGQTARNVMGQIDGSGNPVPGSAAFDAAVWNGDGPSWLHGGSTLVVRRIHTDLETWDAADRTAREFTIGRRLDNGAPLTGRVEADRPDFAAVDGLGFPVIDDRAHIRRAHVGDDRLRIFRRPYNYDDGLDRAGRPDTGLVFASYQADMDRQFVPIQRRLAEADLLNKWVTPIGSAVFAIPPGCGPDGWIGHTLLG